MSVGPFPCLSPFSLSIFPLLSSHDQTFSGVALVVGKPFLSLATKDSLFPSPYCYPLCWIPLFTKRLAPRSLMRNRFPFSSFGAADTFSPRPPAKLQTSSNVPAFCESSPLSARRLRLDALPDVSRCGQKELARTRLQWHLHLRHLLRINVR